MDLSIGKFAHYGNSLERDHVDEKHVEGSALEENEGGSEELLRKKKNPTRREKN
jgi:hypothetical protein